MPIDGSNGSTTVWKEIFYASNPPPNTRQALQSVITRWASSSPKLPPKNETLNIAGASSFTCSFDGAISEVNTTAIFGLEKTLILEAFFEALCEREATAQFREDNHATLKHICSIRERDLHVESLLDTNNKFSWKINFGNITGTSFTELFRAVFNLSRLDALATLAGVVGLSLNNLSQLSSDPHTVESRGISQQHKVNIPDMLLLPGLPAGVACAELMEKRYTYGNAAQIIGAILRYRLNGKDFCLPATVGRGVLCMGKYKPTAHFFNQHLMDQHPFAPIVFFQDMRTALAFERILEETRGYTHEKSIVTAHLGTDLSVLHWNYLHRHEVLFIPAPTKECMALVKLYRDYIAAAQARSFRVYPGLLLHSQPCCDLTGHVKGVTDAEAELLHTAIALDGVERPLGLIQKIISDSVSYNEFVAWGQRLHIFKESHNASNVPSTGQSCSLPPADPALTPPLAHNLDAVTLYHIIRPGSFVALVGPKGSGKTQVAMSTCRGIIYGNTAWPLFGGNGVDAGNIAYIDAETPYDEFRVNQQQHGLAEMDGTRFFGLSRFAPHLPDFCNVFSLTDDAFRKGLAIYLLKNKCRIVVLDNLTALMGDAVHHGKAAQTLLDWVKTLQGHGLCVLLVHHKADDTGTPQHGVQARGSHLYTTLARTVITLVSSAEILNNRLAPEIVQTKAAEDGLTVGVRFDASKPAPVLDKKSFWLHLPLGASQWEFLAATGADGKEIEFAQVCAKPETGLAIQSNPLIDAPESGEVAILGQLSSDEKAVYDMAQTAGSVKTADIVQKLDCCDRKARNLTKSLEERGLLEPNGRSGSQQGYRIKN